MANIDDRRAAQREGIVAYLRGLTNGQILDTLRLLVLSKYGEHPSSLAILARIHHGKSVSWLVFFNRRRYFFWIWFNLFYFFSFLSWKLWKMNRWFVLFILREGRYLEFFCNFFSFAMISLMVGVLHFEEVKVLWILFSIFLGNLGKLVIFHFVEVEIFLLKLVFSFLSFLFLCSLGNYGILESWWLKLFILREKIDILVCFFELYILYFWNKLITSSSKLLF